MHVVEEVDLPSFYGLYLQSIRRQGFRLLILALVRDADSPSFYEDVRRYWSSLNDVTGRHALFAVAGTDASQTLQSMPTSEDRSWTGFSTLVASPAGTTEIEKLRHDAAMLRRNLPIDSPLFQANTRRPSDAESIAEASTGQVSALVRLLGVQEGDVPCLHLTMLRSLTTDTAVLPISILGDFSIYAACKEIMRRLQPTLDTWSASENWRDDPELLWRNVVLKRAEAGFAALAEAEDYERLAAQRRDKRRASALMDANALLAASTHIHELLGSASAGQHKPISELLAKCNDPQRGGSEKAQLFRDIERYQTTEVLTKPQAKVLRTLVARAYSSRLLDTIDQDTRNPVPRRLDVHEKAKAVEVVASARNAIEQRRIVLSTMAMEAEECAAQEFNSLRAALGKSSKEQWDFFISYPAPERALAIKLFQALQLIGRPFLDYFCLRPGQDWTSRLGTVQAGCKTTIVLISEHTTAAHFQLSEIHRALNLMRRSNHRVLPVYTSKRASTPFGLEQIHSVLPMSDDPGDLASRTPSRRDLRKTAQRADERLCDRP